MPTPGTGTGSRGPPQCLGLEGGPGPWARQTPLELKCWVTAWTVPGMGMGTGAGLRDSPMAWGHGEKYAFQWDVPSGSVGTHGSVHCPVCGTRGCDCGTAHGLGTARITLKDTPQKPCLCSGSNHIRHIPNLHPSCARWWGN